MPPPPVDNAGPSGAVSAADAELYSFLIESLPPTIFGSYDPDSSNDVYWDDVLPGLPVNVDIWLEPPFFFNLRLTPIDNKNWFHGITLQHDETDFSTPTISFGEPRAPEIVVDADKIAAENERRAIEAIQQSKGRRKLVKQGAQGPQTGPVKSDPCDLLYLPGHLLHYGSRTQWGIDNRIFDPQWTPENGQTNVNYFDSLWPRPNGRPHPGSPGYDTFLKMWAAFRDAQERYNLVHLYLSQGHTLEDTIEAILNGTIRTNQDKNNAYGEFAFKWMVIGGVSVALFATGVGEVGLLAASLEALKDGFVHAVLDNLLKALREFDVKKWFEENIHSKEDLLQFLSDLTEIAYSNMTTAWLNMWYANNGYTDKKRAGQDSSAEGKDAPCAGVKKELNDLRNRARNAQRRWLGGALHFGSNEAPSGNLQSDWSWG